MTTTSSPIESTSNNVSQRERCAWIQLATTLVVYLPYFTYIAVLTSRGELEMSSMIWPLVGAVAVQIALTIVGILVFAVLVRSEPKDERDRALESRSLRVGYWVLSSTGFSLLVVAPACFGLPLIRHASPLLMLMLGSQGFLLCFLLAEVARFGVLAAGYRRGF